MGRGPWRGQMLARYMTEFAPTHAPSKHSRGSRHVESQAATPDAMTVAQPVPTCKPRPIFPLPPCRLSRMMPDMRTSLERLIDACQEVADGRSTVTQAARKHELSVRTVRRGLRRAGVPPLEPGRPRIVIVLKPPPGVGSNK